MSRPRLWFGSLGLVGAALMLAPLADDLLHGRCPVRRADAGAQERLRGYRVLPQLSGRSARERPALELELGVSRRADVERIIATTGAVCRPGPSERALRCSSWPSTSGVRYVQFFFDARAQLVSVDLFRNDPEDRLRERLAEREREIEAANGPAQVLRSANRSLTSVTLAYSNYLAKLMLLKAGSQPATLREQYDVPGR